jgi:hypothetical protein
MAAPSQTLALPWFTRSDYPALLDLFSDANRLPTTYDAWLERAERIEREFQKAVSVSPRPGSDQSLLRPGATSETFLLIK